MVCTKYFKSKLADYPSVTTNCILLDSEVFGSFFMQAVMESKIKILCSIYMFNNKWKVKSPLNGYPFTEFEYAVKRKVDIRIILGTPAETFNCKNYNRETAKLLKGIGVKVKIAPCEKCLHDKLFIIDNELTIVGSHNYAYNSINNSFNVAIATFSTELNEQAEQIFWSRWRAADNVCLE